jgi:pectinesterase
MNHSEASGREENNDSWYVFDHSTIAAKSGQSVAAGAYWLGRPWRNYARVVFQRTDMTNVINRLGWRQWNEGDPRLDNVYFGEYANTGAGSAGSGARASFTTFLSSPVAIGDVLKGYESAAWFDSSYFAGNGAAIGNSK